MLLSFLPKYVRRTFPDPTGQVKAVPEGRPGLLLVLIPAVIGSLHLRCLNMWKRCEAVPRRAVAGPAC